MKINNNEIIIGELKTLLNEFEQKKISKLLEYKKELDKAFHSVDGILDSWSGSWVGFHSSLYYKNYTKPDWKNMFDSEWGSINGIPNDWQEKTYEDILDYANRHYKGTSIEKIEENVEKIKEESENLQNKFVTDINGILMGKDVDELKQKIDEIDGIKWGYSTSKYIEALRPKNVMSRDTFAISQGLIAPPHLCYQSAILSTKSRIEDIEKFIKLSNNLIRLIEIKMNISLEEQSTEGLSRIKKIFDRFSIVAMQLSRRYNNRPTIQVKDEYDVQDLLHSLLKVDFDDIRAEEWTPSYAGSSTRMDFLLKEEKIVIETKMTRQGLDDKKVGEELIIDRAHYKGHTNCEKLVCFIYDPDHRIKNPRGIEKDLAETNDIEVEVFIRS